MAELQTQLFLAVKVERIDALLGDKLIEDTKLISRQLVGLINYRSQIQKE